MWRWCFAVLLAVVLVWTVWSRWRDRPFDPGPGQVAPAVPQQTDVSGSAAAPFAFGKDEVTPLAEFKATARVLACRRYHLGRESALSPIDVALGWGAMSDAAVLGKLSFSQGNRYYFWHVRGYKAPIPVADIEHGSANMHLIPATKELAAACKRVRVGQVIQFSGLLVEVKGADGWRWRSSLTRDDIGAGACELVYVKEFRVLPAPAATPQKR